MDCLRTFRKNACGFHLIGIALVKAVREKVLRITSRKEVSE
jgi:hypothetical protein